MTNNGDKQLLPTPSSFDPRCVLMTNNGDKQLLVNSFNSCASCVLMTNNGDKQQIGCKLPIISCLQRFSAQKNGLKRPIPPSTAGFFLILLLSQLHHFEHTSVCLCFHIFIFIHLPTEDPDSPCSFLPSPQFRPSPPFPFQGHSRHAITRQDCLFPLQR